MSIITIILVLAFVGFIVYMLQTAPIPINPWFKMLIVGVICFAVIIWLLGLAGFHTGIPLHS